MKAMLLDHITDLSRSHTPLRNADIPLPEPEPGEILVRATACGVCHTELDEIEGRTPPLNFPAVLGHQVTGVVESTGCQGRQISNWSARGELDGFMTHVGFASTAWQEMKTYAQNFVQPVGMSPGGYAEYLTVPEESAFLLPDGLTDAEIAPLLCAGATGYRSLRLTGIQDGQALGLTGFGSSAHLVLKTVRYLFPQVRVYVFTRQKSEQDFAVELGADWAGFAESEPPELLHAMIHTTPAWKPIVEGLRCLRPGGRLVINAIRKEKADQDRLLDPDYPSHLWMEKEIMSVANVSRRDVREFLEIAGPYTL